MIERLMSSKKLSAYGSPRALILLESKPNPLLRAKRAFRGLHRFVTIVKLSPDARVLLQDLAVGREKFLEMP